MNSSEALISSQVGAAYFSLDPYMKRSFQQRMNIGITSCESESGATPEMLAGARDLGFKELSLDLLFGAINYKLAQNGIELRAGNNYKKERGQIVSNILDDIQIEKGPDSFRIAFRSDEDKDTSEKGKSQFDGEVAEITRLMNDRAIYGRVLGFVKKYLAENVGIVVSQSAPEQLVENGLGIVICDKETEVKPDIRRKASKVFLGGNRTSAKFALLREIVFTEAILEQQKALKRSIENRKINLEPKFKLSDWPRDPLMTYIRECVARQTGDFLGKTEMLCDPQDLKYQVLFRLTTFPVKSLFHAGQELEQYLQANGNYHDWRNILKTDPDIVRSYSMNDDLVEFVISEQAAVIQERMERSPLPLESILTPRGIFAEPGWVIQRKNGTVRAVKEEGITSVSDSVGLRFEEIDPALAAQIHNDLHYIHTPRADISFGLFVEGEELPFSALAFEKIDRDYKANTLILNGYDPRKCYDLTRLYSRPGTPGNTSSSMFSLAFGYLKSNYPEIQAVMSSFMPSYATGISMTSGGFDNPVLIKPLKHVFLPKDLGKVKAFEHLTKRRMVSNVANSLVSQVPLLPTAELLCSLHGPAFSPAEEVNKFMIEVVNP